MHTRNFKRGDESFSRPLSKKGGFSRFGHTKRGIPNRAQKRGKGERIDVSRFIHKAVVGEEAVRFVPRHSFADFAIHPGLKRNITKKGFETPTPIQDETIPYILKGRDVVGIANTGTGKTAAFLIPLLDKVLQKKDERVLIVVPTRELAIQIDEEYRGFSHGSGLASVCTVGGVNINAQIRAMQNRPHFVIGTPGRLKDLINRRMLNLIHFRTVVLDEADRMLDMGFIHDMRFLMAQMPADRHTLFFSATISSQIEGLISEFLSESVRISVKTGQTPKNVEQDIVRIRDGTKFETLQQLLQSKECNKVLIFGRTKHGVEKLSVMLEKHGIKSKSIHGNKSQSQRAQALGMFKNDRISVLVATDVAARGLDIPDVSHVINYDLPATYDDYVHRIGRTGRGDKQGKALTFVE